MAIARGLMTYRRLVLEGVDFLADLPGDLAVASDFGGGEPWRAASAYSPSPSASSASSEDESDVLSSSAAS